MKKTLTFLLLTGSLSHAIDQAIDVDQDPMSNTHRLTSSEVTDWQRRLNGKKVRPKTCEPQNLEKKTEQTNRWINTLSTMIIPYVGAYTNSPDFKPNRKIMSLYVEKLSDKENKTKQNYRYYHKMAEEALLTLDVSLKNTEAMPGTPTAPTASPAVTPAAPAASPQKTEALPATPAASPAATTTTIPTTPSEAMAVVPPVTPAASPAATPAASPAAAPAASPAASPAATPAASPAASPAAAPAASPAATPAATPAASPAATPAASPAAAPAASPAASPAATPAASPAASPAATPAASPAASPAATPAASPAAPAASPAASPAAPAASPAATPAAKTAASTVPSEAVAVVPPVAPAASPPKVESVPVTFASKETSAIAQIQSADSFEHYRKLAFKYCEDKRILYISVFNAQEKLMDIRENHNEAIRAIVDAIPYEKLGEKDIMKKRNKDIISTSKEIAKALEKKHSKWASRAYELSNK